MKKLKRPCLDSLGLPLHSKRCLSTLSFSPSHSTYTHPPRNVYNRSNTNHQGIPGNEKPDKVAKDATHQSTISKSLLPSYSDLFYRIKKFINQHRFALCKTERTKGNKLAQLQGTPVPWNSSNLRTRSQEITLTHSPEIRPHSHHTYLSHLSPHASFMPSLR